METAQSDLLFLLLIMEKEMSVCIHRAIVHLNIFCLCIPTETGYERTKHQAWNFAHFTIIAEATQKTVCTSIFLKRQCKSKWTKCCLTGGRRLWKKNITAFVLALRCFVGWLKISFLCPSEKEAYHLMLHSVVLSKR